TAEYESRTYAFCRSGFKRAFEEEPATYASIDRATVAVGAGAMAVGAAGVVAGAAPASAAAAATPGQPVIDEGMRRWYESCSCCLSDAFPEIKAALDAERAAAAEPPVGAGICEVAEAGVVTETAQPATA
ncbi:MAG: hypothetical protein ABIV26_03155, partial [Candidatus Limnocylindrales bacterium]